MSARPVLRRWLWFGALCSLFLVGSLVFMAGLDMQVGRAGSLIGLVAALVPLAIVVPAVLWLDRFEAEPTRYLVTAFLWGACVATAGALVLNTSSMVFLTHVAEIDGVHEVAAVMVAPVVEEVLKGLGVLLIMVLRRNEFDGIVDGIVYAAICAAGFAFAENILYFGRGFDSSGTTGLFVVLLSRGIFGPFAHPMFTVCTGIGLGIAAGYTAGKGGRLRAPLLGLVAAIVLHAAWNLTALLGAAVSLTVYVLLQVPIFLVISGFAAWARRREGRIIAEELSGFVPVGLFQPPEVTMLSSLPARRRAREWARSRGGSAAATDMQHFQDDATELAFLRHRVRHGTAPADFLDQEGALLQEISRLRERLYL
ncbi:PrsW family intramembrane metalloprotease [Austwickia chelonae]|uniref:PrsW family intramembrane metalloprotease n=1 Tax=Austwickia chelonae TaxID=100225 RepID=UPI00196888BC|nr:PrsW family intramembrane metalloprotease [Austwickia chelonae]